MCWSESGLEVCESESSAEESGLIWLVSWNSSSDTLSGLVKITL